MGGRESEVSEQSGKGGVSRREGERKEKKEEELEQEFQDVGQEDTSESESGVS